MLQNHARATRMRPILKQNSFGCSILRASSGSLRDTHIHAHAHAHTRTCTHTQVCAWHTEGKDLSDAPRWGRVCGDFTGSADTRRLRASAQTPRLGRALMDTGRPVQPRASPRAHTGGQSAMQHTDRSRPTRCRVACVCGPAPAAPPPRPATGLGGKRASIVGRRRGGRALRATPPRTIHLSYTVLVILQRPIALPDGQRRGRHPG